MKSSFLTWFIRFYCLTGMQGLQAIMGQWYAIKNSRMLFKEEYSRRTRPTPWLLIISKRDNNCVQYEYSCILWEWISTTCYILFTSVQFYIITPLYVPRILQLCVFLLLSKLYVDCTQDKSEMTSIKYMYISSVWGMIGNVNMILFSLKKNDVTLVKETDHTKTQLYYI